MGACTSAPRAVEASSPIIATKSSGVDNVTSTQASSPRPPSSIAVFGSFDSGKTTLIRKLWLLYGSSYSQSERESFRTDIDATILDGTFTLLHAFLELNPPIPLPVFVTNNNNNSNSSPISTPNLIPNTSSPSQNVPLNFQTDAIIEEHSNSPRSCDDSRPASVADNNNNTPSDENNDNTNIEKELSQPIGSVTPTVQNLFNIDAIPEDLILPPAQDYQNTTQITPQNQTTQSETQTTDLQRPSSASSSISQKGAFDNNPQQPLSVLLLTLQQPVGFYLENPQFLTTAPNPSNELIEAIYALLQLESELFQSTAPYGVINPFIHRNGAIVGGNNTNTNGISTSFIDRSSGTSSFNSKSTALLPSGQQNGQIGPMSPAVLLQGHPIGAQLAKKVITIWNNPVMRYLYQHSHMLYKATPIMNNTVHVNNNNNNLVMFCEGYLKRIIQIDEKKQNQDSNNYQNNKQHVPNYRRNSIVFQQNTNSHEIVQDLDLLLMKSSHYHPSNNGGNTSSGVSPNTTTPKTQTRSVDQNNNDQNNIQMFDHESSSSRYLGDLDIQSDNKPSPLEQFQFEPYYKYFFDSADFSDLQHYFQEDLLKQEVNYSKSIQDVSDFNTPFSTVFRKYKDDQVKKNNSELNSSQPDRLSTGEVSSNTPAVAAPSIDFSASEGLDIQRAIMRTNSTLGPECYLPPSLFSLDNVEEPMLPTPQDQQGDKPLRDILEDSTLPSTPNGGNNTAGLSTPTKNPHRGSISFRAVVSPRSSSVPGNSNPNTQLGGLQSPPQKTPLETSPQQQGRVLRPSPAQAKIQDLPAPLNKQGSGMITIAAIEESSGVITNNNEDGKDGKDGKDVIQNNEENKNEQNIQNGQNNDETSGITTISTDPTQSTPQPITETPQPTPTEIKPTHNQHQSPTSPTKPSPLTALSIYDCAGNSRGQAEWPLVIRQDVKLMYYVISLTEFLNASSQLQYGFALEVTNTNSDRAVNRARSYSQNEDGDFSSPQRPMGSPQTTRTSLLDNNNNNSNNSNNNNNTPMSPLGASNNVGTNSGNLNKYFQRADNINKFVRKNVMLFSKTINSHVVGRDTEVVVVFSKYDLLVKHLSHQKSWFLQNKPKDAPIDPTSRPNVPLQSPFAAGSIHTLPQESPHIILFNEIFPTYTGDNFDPHEITRFLVDLYLAKISIQDKDVNVVAPQSGLVYLQNNYKKNQSDSDVNGIGDIHIDNVINPDILLHSTDQQEVKPAKQRRKTIFTFDLDEDGQQPQSPQSNNTSPEQSAHDLSRESSKDDNKAMKKEFTEKQLSLLKQEILIRDTFDCSVLYLEPISRLVAKAQSK